ncbi:MAG TPA: thioredoxin-disulfide reductase [Firmicutes bacterium]|nr:thioredoxin-disulfide reductase [Bacillota bacterium]
MYDLAIIGGGPAGLTAGLYGARANLKTIIIEKGLYGGQMQNTLEIENYPGFKNVGGPELSEHMYNQALAVGCEWKYGDVTQVSLEGQPKVLEVSGEKIEARSVIIASGAQPRKLGVPGEKELSGRGVSYCATCDGAFYEDLEVVVVGGGDSAVEEGMFLTRYASSVTVIHRRDTLRAQPILQQRAFANPKMKFIFNSEVQEIQGDKRVSGVLVRSNKDGSTQVIPCSGVFIYVGFFPNSEYLKGTGILDEQGYVVTGPDMKTAIPGVFAAGDVRNTPLRQIVSAAGDGAIAAMQAYHYLENL